MSKVHKMLNELTKQQKIILAIGGVFLLGVGLRAITRVRERRFVEQETADFTADYNETDFTEDYNHQVLFNYSDRNLRQMFAANNIEIPRVPQTIKVVMDEYTFSSAETRITRFFWDSIESDEARAGWVPASMMKIFAAVGAAQRLSELGVGGEAQITFLDTNQTVSIKELINKSIIESDNMTYNRLVQLAGHQSIYQKVLAEFPNTELNTPYMKDDWQSFTGGNRTFASPEIIISDDERTTDLPSEGVRAPVLCKGSSACTTLSELNLLMARILFFNDLKINDSLREVLISALGAQKPRGQEFLKSIIKRLKNQNIVTYDKHGFNGEWYSETLVILNENRDKAFIISAVGAKGNKSILNDLGRSLGELINKL